MLDKDTYYKKKLKLILLQTFNMVLKTEESFMKAASENNDLSVAEIHTLVAVGRKQPKTMSEIAQELLINVSTLSISIKKLEAKGFVSRLRAPEDRRVVRIELTEKGRNALAEHEKFYYDLVEEIVGDVSDDEKQYYINLAEKLMNFFKNKLAVLNGQQPEPEELTGERND
ncbi:MAG: MarR family winged helix-turn-helix transcriptional regulator [Clostridia bacterium]|nr:MarR family winged helix-turn-helix transcriptional regulator [Clostridia bacterium]